MRALLLLAFYIGINLKSILLSALCLETQPLESRYECATHARTHPVRAGCGVPAHARLLIGGGLHIGEEVNMTIHAHRYTINLSQHTCSMAANGSKKIKVRNKQNHSSVPNNNYRL